MAKNAANKEFSITSKCILGRMNKERDQSCTYALYMLYKTVHFIRRCCWLGDHMTVQREMCDLTGADLSRQNYACPIPICESYSAVG